MTARIIDGKKIAEEVRREVKQEVDALRKRKITPLLVAVLVGENPASKIYVSNKVRACEEVGIGSEVLKLPQFISEEDLAAEVMELNRRKDVSGIIVQSPLPDQIVQQNIFAAVDPNKDVDGFHPFNLGLLLLGMPRFIPATPLGIQELLVRSGIETGGKHVVVIGRGNIVGKPLAALLLQKSKGADATVTICHTGTKKLMEITRTADILVAAIGKPNYVTAEMVKPPVVVIDVGINRVEDKSSPKGYRL
ncbi:MAG: bifunctional 5,10-methylenetetrahydrofolate dehydrogenase/5,10-methenyltetrahydrofolate cyclohydrolase, partial [candidate division Zixibacteria bacterium]|nr:bifunctional 5,10-methylenetetrahydrofolate dehydrogenase/5,10-methenyltetrahydrofolate cyclohydrolase [candidate division Zixibacteria bacterium]